MQVILPLIFLLSPFNALIINDVLISLVKVEPLVILEDCVGNTPMVINITTAVLTLLFNGNVMEHRYSYVAYNPNLQGSATNYPAVNTAPSPAQATTAPHMAAGGPVRPGDVPGIPMVKKISTAALTMILNGNV